MEYEPELPAMSGSQASTKVRLIEGTFGYTIHGFMWTNKWDDPSLGQPGPFTKPAGAFMIKLGNMALAPLPANVPLWALAMHSIAEHLHLPAWSFLLAKARAKLLGFVIVLAFGLATDVAANGTVPPLWIGEVFSNADGSVQFIQLNGPSTGIAGLRLFTGDGLTTHSFTFPSDLPAGARNPGPILVATQGFADLNLVKPDFVVPNGFIFLPFCSFGFDAAHLGGLIDMPTDGVRAAWSNGDGGLDWVVFDAVATNSQGQSYTFRGTIVADNSFRIAHVYSNRDGSIQYIQLKESEGRNGQHRLAGRALRVGAGKEFIFPSDLPSDVTANETVLLATKAGLPFYSAICCAAVGEWNLLAPDFILPDRFLSVESMTLNFVGIDYWQYGSLPTDGVSALDHDLNVVPARPRPFQKPQVGPGTEGGAIIVAATPIKAVEYFNANRDHYFLTAWAPDLAFLESPAGRALGWVTTGQTISVWAAPSKDVPDFNVPICRFYIYSADSHFIAASPEECAAVKTRFPEFILETPSAFVVAPIYKQFGFVLCRTYPNSGFTVPVYRLWNGRPDSNHRYTINRAIRDSMVANGWIAEGDGPDRIAFCASW